ncbi:MAG: hypothetical protein GWN00_32880, partial [Aliifodinibius sp.]|nr:hypothetical protein [Fodinibius sp.]NIY29412.1 hypothetical protein [Fodinibius sp.]
MVLFLNKSSYSNVVGHADGRTQWIETGTTPNGLTSVEWQSIQAQIAPRPYQITVAANGSFISDNPANQWQTTYNANGATQFTSMEMAGTTWQWSLKLTSYGYGAGLEVTQPIALSNEGETLTYQWDTNLSEWWVNTAEGQEQGFTLLERPHSAVSTTPLVLEMAVNGNL